MKQTIEVEVKIIGMYERDFLTVSKVVAINEGGTPKEAVTAVYRSGAISKDIYKKIKGFKLPVYLVHNDVKCERKPNKIRLENGDTLTVMQLMSGG